MKKLNQQDRLIIYKEALEILVNTLNAIEYEMAWDGSPYLCDVLGGILEERSKDEDGDIDMDKADDWFNQLIEFQKLDPKKINPISIGWRPTELLRNNPIQYTDKSYQYRIDVLNQIIAEIESSHEK